MAFVLKLLLILILGTAVANGLTAKRADPPLLIDGAPASTGG